MNRKIRIASVLALAGFLSASAPSAASAGTPLLSGYGGPGAGEQAIVGSTLLGVRGGGGSSGSGSGGSGGSGATSTGGSTSAGGSGAGASHSGGSSAGPSSTKHPVKEASSQAGHSRGAGAAALRAHVYPNSPASDDSRLIGISGGDVLPIVGIVVALTLIGALTVRFVRLQP